jgi:hypothetical protein
MDILQQKLDLNELIKTIRIKNIASAQDIKFLNRQINECLKNIVDTKREIINELIKGKYTHNGFYKVDQVLPWSIQAHRFEGALSKYQKAAEEYELYNILNSELLDFKPIIDQALAIKKGDFESLNKEFPLNEKINSNIVEIADLLEESVLPTLKQMCYECSIRLKWVNYDDLLKAELARVRSAAYSKLFDLNPIKIENVSLSHGKDGVEGKWYITEKDSSRWRFEFEAILAGGFNIQCLHTRTLSTLIKLS